MLEFNPKWYKRFVENTNEKNILISKISDILKNKEKAKCLEIGLGISPVFAESLAKDFQRYLIVEKCIDEAKLSEGVEIINNDWESVSLDEKFDVIIASHVFYYFKDKKRAVEKMFKHLNDNGRIIFVVNGKEADYGPMKLFFSEIIGERYVFTYDEVYESLEGYSIREYTYPTEVSYDSYEDLFEILRLIFDNYEEGYGKNKEKMTDYFKENFKGRNFIVDQKILEVSKK